MGRPLVQKVCKVCGKRLRRNSSIYCSNKCQTDYQYMLYIQRWKQGLEDGLKGRYSISNHIRRYFLNKYDHKCQKCGWGLVNPYSGLVPLEIHHIDGNYKNNNESNLQILCPNCHALTSMYKALNRSGRKDRCKY